MSWVPQLNLRWYNQMDTIPPYAPASASQSQRYQSQSSVPADKEIRLYTSAKQREIYESLAELFSVIVALDKLEKAYLRDSIGSDDYTPACLRLIAQYNTLLKNETLAKEFVDLETFKRKYHLEHDRATSRLKVGVPATVEQAIEHSALPGMNNNINNSNNNNTSNGNNNNSTSNASARAVAEATGNFITLMDGLKLSFRAKDKLHPLLSNVVTSLNKVTTSDFEGRAKIVEWLITLNALRANEEISEVQAREMIFDIDNAYKSFYTSL